MKRSCLFGLPINITSMDEVVETLINAQKPTQLVTINPEMIDKAQNNSEIADLIKSADFVTPDGIGVVMALKMVGIKTNRIPGIELAYNLLKIANEKGLKVALVGADEDTIQTAKKELLKDLPNLNIVYLRNGYFNNYEEENILQELANIQPDILLAGLGFPKQEQFLSNFKKLSKCSIMIGVGGSFDVWSKKVKRAPMIFQKLNLEWFYRLLCQPSRFNRVFPTIPLFLLKVPLKYKLHRKEY